MNLTPELVKSYWEYMTRKHRTEVRYKTDAEEMKSLADLLSVMGVLDPTDFMTRFATTIGRTIYLPFQIGDASSFSLWSQIEIGAHEHQHVVQLDSDPNFFSTNYVLDPTKRAHYEAEAYRVSMTMNFWATGCAPQPDMYVESLKHYGIDEKGIDFAREYLRLSRPTILTHGIPDQAAKDTIGWFQTNAPTLLVSPS
jgi:hypothetical protein